MYCTCGYTCSCYSLLVQVYFSSSFVQYDDDTKTVSLHLKARREVFCQLACELLFRDETNCGDVDQFIACFETYFKTVLSLPQLQANSIHDLIATQEVVDFVEVCKTMSCMCIYSHHAESIVAKLDAC